MEAAVQRRYGPPEVLATERVADPVVGPHDVLVEVLASPVTYGDRRMRAADFPPMFRWPAYLLLGFTGPRHPVPGTMFAGRVLAVGAQVTRFSPGQDVFGSSLRGAYATRLVMREDGAIGQIPAGVDHSAAAAAPYGAFTALYFLRDLGRVRPGQRVLIVGAAGGVGDFAVQVAKDLGAHVTAVCAPRAFDRMRELGADRWLDPTTDFTAGDERWDVVFDTAGAVGFRRCQRVLTPGGVHLTLEMSLGVWFWSLVSWARGGQRTRTGSAMCDQAAIGAVADLLARGAVRPRIRAQWPLARIADAHADAERRGVDGVVLVNVAGV